MTQEDKDLLLRDLCCRLPYGVICRKDCKTVDNEDFYLDKYPSPIELAKYLTIDDMDITIKPYLRPMSSVAKEEKKEARELGILFAIGDNHELLFDGFGNVGAETQIKAIDWLNAHHFDYRGLIEKGLAIAVNENNNPYIY